MQNAGYNEAYFVDPLLVLSCDVVRWSDTNSH